MPTQTELAGSARNLAFAGPRCRRGYQTDAANVYGELSLRQSNRIPTEIEINRLRTSQL
jgi:hypothetical protein